MVKKTQRLQLLIDLQIKQERQALADFGQCRNQVRQIEERLQQLQTYRQDYLEKYSRLTDHSGVSVNTIQEYRAFLHKLEQVITKQLQSLNDKQEQVQKFRQVWEQKQLKLKGLQKIQVMALAEERAKEDKIDQSEQDEYAGRMNRKNGMGNA